MTTFPLSLAGIAFAAVIFVAAVAFTYGIGILVAPPPEQRRLAAIGTSAPDLDESQGRLARWLHALARASTPEDRQEITPLRLRLWRAGWRSRNAPVAFFALKTALTLALPAVLLLYTGVLSSMDSPFVLFTCLAALAALGYYLPDIVLGRVIRRRQRELFFAFPDALDVMRICVEAGLSLDAAIQRVARDIRLECPPLSEELHQVALELRAGASRRQAMLNLAARVKLEDVDALVSMLVQADRFGTSVADALRVHSSSLRARRRLAAEERAAKLPVKLLVPLVLFIFPSLLTVLLGPAAISIYRVLLPTIIAGGGGR
jgi:tight adherence protein C